MGDRYRIIIKGKKFYKEIEVDSETNMVRFGTASNCDVRIRKEIISSDSFEIIFSKDNTDKWSIMCSDNLYIAADDVRKLFNQPLKHGDELIIKHKDSSISFFTINFLIDFDYESKEYNRRFNISAMNNLSIGSQSDNNIVIRGKYISGDKVYLYRQGNELLLRVVATEYGVYHNGELVKQDVIIYDGDFFSIADISFYYKKDMLYTQQSNSIQGNGVSSVDSTKRGIYPKFVRNSRIKNELITSKIEILDPPSIPKKPKNNILSRMLPSIIMCVVSLAMGMAGGVFVFVSMASALAGIISAVINLRESKNEYENMLNDRVNKYNAYIQKKTGEIIKERNAELSELQEKYISEEQEIDNLKNFSCDLFDRRPKDDDFLEVRLGLGKVEAKKKIEYKKQERLEIEDELQLYPENIANQYEYLMNAPIVCNFKKANGVGIIGEERCRFSILKNILVDICARHYHSDIKMFFVAKSNHADVVKKMRMLPQVYNEALGIHNIVCNDSSRTVIFEYLYKELSLREQGEHKEPHIIIFLYDEYEFKSHPISKFVDCARELGVTFVFFGQTRADICQGCDYLIEMANDTQGILINTADGKNVDNFVVNSISDGDLAAMIQLMAPVYTEEISLEGSLTKNISLFEMLDVIATYDIDLEKQWSSSKVYNSMAAPIGVIKSGILELDLHDKAHGPHGLVAGTTGAGKSELLQTYIMSMATKYHPYEVGFVIIDFKGGGMANQFEKLPHLIGTITNIDGKEINRSLRSIKAELQKRQRLFKDAEVNHIDKYIIKYKDGEVNTPLPHLIVIVDEFAELKANQPEFMKELISAARIGRSLGVHLILATQKPSGQVDDQIWSNSRFKLCLKVQSGQDSNEVLKSPVAAEIKEPGRAYLQVGNNEIFELFQSAYSGAPEHEDDTETKEFVIYEITDSGKRIPVYVQKKKKSDGSNNTQLDAVVKYVREHCKAKGINKLQSICLPSLERVINFPMHIKEEGKVNGIVAELGIYDDPDNQIQDVYSIDLSNQNVMIIGSSQSGKTNLLQTIIRGLATKYSPKEVNMYILDFGSMVLKNYEGLNHVGGVVYSYEEEKCKNLFKLLYEEINKRKEILNSVNVSSYSAYREAGFTELPQIVLFIDNLTVMRELYLLDNDFLLPICRDGISVGISVVVANSQTAGIGYKYLANFEQRIAFYCNDTTEYNVVFDYCRIQPDTIPGRCLVSIDKAFYEMQSFLAFDGEKEIDRTEQIKDFVHEINEKNNEYNARKIPIIPDVLSEKNLVSEFRVENDKNRIAIGLDFETVSPIYIDWDKQSVLGILGKLKKSKENFINYMKKTLCDIGASIYIIDDYSGVYESLNVHNSVKLYSKNIEDTEEILTEIKQKLMDRYVERDMKGVSALNDMEPIVLLIHNQDAAASIAGNVSMFNLYKEIIGKYKGLKCCIIYTNMANENFAYGSGSNGNEVMRQMKDSPQFIVFEDIKEIKVFDVTQSLIRKYGTLKDNEGYMRLGNELSKVKIVSLLK